MSGGRGGRERCLLGPKNDAERPSIEVAGKEPAVRGRPKTGGEERRGKYKEEPRRPPCSSSKQGRGKKNTRRGVITGRGQKTSENLGQETSNTEGRKSKGGKVRCKLLRGNRGGGGGGWEEGGLSEGGLCLSLDAPGANLACERRGWNYSLNVYPSRGLPFCSFLDRCKWACVSSAVVLLTALEKRGPQLLEICRGGVWNTYGKMVDFSIF